MIQRSTFRATLLCLAIVALGIAFTGCVNAPAAKETVAARYNPGVYTATAEGIGGQIVVQVTFSAAAITDIKVLSDNETEGVGKVAVKELPGKIVAGQTLAVDAVSGATVSSTAILAAVEECVKKAGGDVAALKAK
jgi:fumarate reductase flavoprotein subunit